MRRAAGVLPALVALLAVTSFAAACSSSGGGDVVRSGGSLPASSSAASSSAASSSAASTSATPGGPAVTVSPSRNLTNGQSVTVTATGFRPNEALVVIQCADKGTATSSGDCNLTMMQSLTTDAKGGLVARLPVARGPFGTNKVICSAEQACIVSVNPATPSPTEQASAPISFVG